MNSGCERGVDALAGAEIGIVDVLVDQLEFALEEIFVIRLGQLIERIPDGDLDGGAGLALFDILGEFAAQGTFAIQLNVSFAVASVLLVLAIIYRRKARIAPAV